MRKGGASLSLTTERPPKRLVAGFQDLPTIALAECRTLDAVMRHVIRPLWAPMPRVAGPAYTVRTVAAIGGIVSRRRPWRSQRPRASRRASWWTA